MGDGFTSRRRLGDPSVPRPSLREDWGTPQVHVGVKCHAHASSEARAPDARPACARSMEYGAVEARLGWQFVVKQRLGGIGGVDGRLILSS